MGVNNRTIKLMPPAEDALREMATQVSEWRAEGVECISLDFTPILFLESMGIGFLVKTVLTCRRFGIRVELTGLRAEVRRSILHAGIGELVGLGDKEPPSFDSTPL